METALTVRGQSLPTQSMSEIATAGELLAQSGMFGVKNAAAGFVVVATCHQQGISLMEFNRTYHIVEGKPSMRADAMLAEFRKAGGRYKIVENSQTRAAAEFTFEGQVIPFEFTMDDAKRTGDCLNSEGKVKSVWQKRPEDMLWARMVSRAVRRLCPEINAGVYTPEEVADFDKPAKGAPISQDEALRRAKVVKADPAPAPAAEIEDATTCPIGGDGYAGQPWESFTSEELEAGLDSDDPAMTHAHKAAIRLVLNERSKQEGVQ